MPLACQASLQTTGRGTEMKLKARPCHHLFCQDPEVGPREENTGVQRPVWRSQSSQWCSRKETQRLTLSKLASYGETEPCKGRYLTQGQPGLFLPLCSKAAGSLSGCPSLFPRALLHREAVCSGGKSPALRPGGNWILCSTPHWPQSALLLGPSVSSFVKKG